MNATEALYQSLIRGPLLMAQLPEATIFPYQLLQQGNLPPLNLEQKLGHLYEDTLANLLQATPAYGLLERNLQIRDNDGRTLGELDYLLQDLDTNQLIHLELAVKFYLAIETEDTLQLPGPDARDNYFRKLERMRSHQLTLTNRFRHFLPEAYRDQNIETHQLVYGCIFQHIHSKEGLKIDSLNPNCRYGKWLHVSEIPDYFGINDTLEIIPKHLWPVHPELLESINLQSWVLDSPMERCVMIRSRSERHATYFITPDDYPEISPASSIIAP